MRDVIIIGAGVTGSAIARELSRYDRDVLVLFYECEIVRGEPVTADCNAIAWVRPEELRQYDFAGADRAFVERQF